MKQRIPNDYIIYQILVPSLHKKLKFRPFTIKENKALTIAQSTGDDLVISDTLKSVIINCCVDQHQITEDQLMVFDLEYLLIKLRAISIGNTVLLTAMCEDEHDGFPPSTRETDVVMDLNDVEIVGIDSFTQKIQLSDDMFVFMKNPTMDLIKTLDFEEHSDSEQMINAQLDNVCKMIDKVVAGEEVYLFDSYTDQEKREWIENLSETQFINLKHYYSTFPKTQVKISWTCPHCGKENNRIITGLSYFF